MIYLVYGVFSLFEGQFFPFPFIMLLVPLICIVFFIMSIKHGGSIFFIFFPLIAVEPLMSGLLQVDLSWLSYLSMISSIIFIASNLFSLQVWKNFKWIPIVLFINLVSANLILIFSPEQLIYPLIPLLGLSLYAVILNTNKFELPGALKRQILVVSFASGLVVVSILSTLLIE